MYPDEDEDFDATVEVGEPPEPDLEEDEDEDEDDEVGEGEDEIFLDEVPEAPSKLPFYGDPKRIELMRREHVEEKVVCHEFSKLKSDAGYTCELTMENGFVVLDASYSAVGMPLPEAEAQQRSYERALEKAFELETYAFLDREHRGAKSE